MIRFDDCPQLLWLRSVNPAFHAYRYMRVTADAVLIDGPGGLGSSYAESFRRRHFEVIR
jgi:hypothetical protein